MNSRPLHSILILLFLAALNDIHAQTTTSFSILNQDEDYTRAREYYERAVRADEAGLTDSTAYYIRRSLEISINKGYRDLSADNYRLLGLAFDRIPDWENTLRNLLRAGSGYAMAGMKTSEAEIWDIIAGKYFSFEVYRKAVDYSRRSFTLYSPYQAEEKATRAELAGRAAFMHEDYYTSVRWFDSAAAWYGRKPDTAGIIRALRGSSSSYLKILDATIPVSKMWIGNYNVPSVMASRMFGNISGSLASLHYEDLIAIHVKQKDNEALAGVYNNLGYIYFRQELYARAREYFLLAVDLMQKAGAGDAENASTLTNLAICYMNSDDEDLAMRTFNRALTGARKAGALSEMARIEHILARIYLKNNDFYHSEQYCNDCIESSTAPGNFDILQQCYHTLSEVMERGNDFIRALEYFQRHLTLRDSLALADELAATALDQKVEYYEALEQKLLLDISDEDMRYLTITKLRADSLTMQSNLRALRSDSLSKQSEIMALRATAELKASEEKRLRQAYDLEVERNTTAQQQRDIEALEQEKTITELTLKAQQDEQERLLKEVELEKAKRKTALIFVVLAIIIALTILGSLISSRNKNRKLAESKKHIEEINLDLEQKNREVSEQKEVIEQKNKSITDSIQYASRIQAAVLPPVTFMNDWGLENFIFFMPKDIVSGDFYWGTRKRGKVIIAAADCTGHGVPGAFMSMLGNAFLNEIINTAEELDAATILNILRDDVIKALKQKGIYGEARDGMDIALCVLDPETMSGTFAGANNPLYLVRDGRLTKVPADRMPIGIHVVAEKPFQGRPLKLMKGDMIYLFTDGYADQFGGPEGKKFMYKPFQDLIASVSHEPVGRQYEVLAKVFNDWQGSYEQVDDVLVMGFKV